MAKMARAKRPTETITDITIEHPDTGTAPVQSQPFADDFRKPVHNSDPTPEEQAEFNIPGSFGYKEPKQVNSALSVEPGNEVKIINLDVAAIKFDINQQQIDEFKKLVPTLTIKDIDDREGYAKVYETRQKLKKARTGAKDKAAELTEDAKKFTKAVNDQFKKYEEQLKPLEATLQEKEDWFENEKKRIAEEKELEKKNKQDAEDKLVRDRTAILLSAGCTFDFDNGNFLFKDVVVTAEQLKILPVEQFDTIASQIRMVHEEDLENEKQHQLEIQRKEQELEEGRKALKKEMTDFRKFQLTSSGMEDGGIQYYFRNTVGTIAVTIEQIENAPATDWQKLLSNAIAEISKFKSLEQKAKSDEKEETERQAKENADAYLREQTLELRKQQLESLGYKFNNVDTANYWFTHISGDQYSFRKDLFETYDVTKWNIAITGWKDVSEQYKSTTQQNAIKVEKRRGDLRAEGLTVEKTFTIAWGECNAFVYRGQHVVHPFIPDTDETLLKRNDDWWENTTIPGVRTKVAALKEADQQEITRLLNEETEKRNNAKGDKEKLQDVRNGMYLLWTTMPKDLVTPNSIALITRISAGLDKSMTLLDDQIALLTI